MAMHWRWIRISYLYFSFLVFSFISPFTIYAFTDDPLQPGVTVVKAIHITELRSAIATKRQKAGLSSPAWTDANLTTGAS